MLYNCEEKVERNLLSETYREQVGFKLCFAVITLKSTIHLLTHTLSVCVW
jgi:hypothetical protein